ncbi:tryptophan 7-halogenase [Nocardia sp. NPDC048505]|uniref:tryptophan 7-halogenase n=1 Tax=Nocardia sp. NPDC048505 TaxID=3155756 RepID=UPI0033DF879C
MSAPHPEHFDVVVVGGGPAGSTVSTLVAKEGRRVLQLEQARFPRYQIGESLLPSTVHGIAKLLGVDAKIREAGFVKKNGGTFLWGSSPEPWTFSFSYTSALSGPTSFAYQVERMKFDQILLENARASGVSVREECSVTEVIETGDRVIGVRYRDSDGALRAVHCDYVVDASGNKSRIRKYVGGSRDYSVFFRNLALFGYFEGGKRLDSPNSGNILCAAFEDGWFWYIPLTSELTSVGAVIRRDAADKIQRDPAAALQGLIESCPIIKEYLSEAERVQDGPYGELRIRKDYSYCNSTFWKPGMVLVGDAACFIDPVFSSGVHLATYSALLAARSVNSVLAGEISESRAFEEFELRYRREYRVFHDFLVAFYGTHSDTSSYFWEAKRITECPRSELESFVELVGGISSGETDLTASDNIANRLELRANAFANAVSTGDAEHGALHTNELVSDAMQESVKLQEQALLGIDASEDKPMFPGGLVSALDSIRWREPRRR